MRHDVKTGRDERPWVLAAAMLLPGLALLAPAGRADEPAAAFPDWAEAKSTAVRHLRLDMQGQHAGGMELRLGRLPDGRLLVEEHAELTITRAVPGHSDTFRVDTTSLDLYSADLSLAAKRSVSKEAGVTETRETVVRDGVAVIRVQGPGGTFVRRVTVPPGHSNDWQVFAALKASWKDGEVGHKVFQELDDEAERFQECEIWLLGKTRFVRGTEEHAAWRVRWKAEDASGEMIVDDDGVPFEASLMDGAVKATWVDEPAFDTKGAGWALSAYIDVDRGIPRMLMLDQLELKVVVEPPLGPDEPAPFLDNDYQTVARVPGGYRLVLHHRRPPVDFAPVAFPVRTVDPDVARYLAPTPSSQSAHPSIVALARRLTTGAPESFAATRRIVSWVWANVVKKSGARGGATALEVLEALQGDCTEHAVLVVALCRAAGIPARAVGGIEYLVDERGKPLAGYHAWGEAWIGRWLPIDATIPEAGTSARYIHLGVDEPGEPRAGGSLTSLITRKVRLEVLAWKHVGEPRVEAVTTVR